MRPPSVLPLSVFLTFLGPLSTLQAQGPGTITTYAGGGPNNLPATAALLGPPSGVVVDAAGNVFLASGDRVYRVNTSGVETVVAGSPLTGFSGDGGPATEAELSVGALAMDNAGNLFIADFNANRVRRVDASSGFITTVAGNGVTGFGGDGGPATKARLNSPPRSGGGCGREPFHHRY